MSSYDGPRCGTEYTALALKYVQECIGVVETYRNRGPLVDAWQRGVGLRLDEDPKAPGHPYCVAGLYTAAFERAAREMEIACPFPRTAKAVKVYERAHKDCRVSKPGRGVVYILVHGERWKTEWKSDSYTDAGHAGIIERATLDVGDIDEISFNTFGHKGSREGNTVARHHGEPEVTHGGMLLGMLDFSLAPMERARRAYTR